MSEAPKDLGIQYVELAVTDVPAAKEFYGKAFGWTFQDYGPTYASFSNAAVDGGFSGETPEHIGRPLVILYAIDLEGAVGRVERAGGKVVKPIFSFPGGRRFHFTDPAGNELAIWSDK
ncbi:MAG: VOC family protein [Gemmatimonadota bacterium]|nr:VOC family protein [Gemmatimonadota bacterium]